VVSRNLAMVATRVQISAGALLADFVSHRSPRALRRSANSLRSCTGLPPVRVRSRESRPVQFVNKVSKITE